MEANLPRFFHGTLEAVVFHAVSPTPSCPFRCMLRDKPAHVTVDIGKDRVAETSHESSRVWNQTFHILCAHSPDTTITITLRTGLLVLGKALIPARALLTKAYLNPNDPLPLLNKKGNPIKNLNLRLSLQFRHVEDEPDRESRLGLSHGVTFPERSNCSITLYQDAHHGRLFQPPITLAGGQPYRPRKLWEDVFTAIDDAKHLICIAGWSLNPKMVLVRDPDTEIPHAIGVELGVLLKRKADERVSVRILLWDDETSLPIIKNRGVMRTHDEDAFSYFNHTKVICKLSPRLHHSFPTLFAHHQKTITVDAGGDVISFIGGLDLCDGRYDTEEHSLFRTLNSHDFYQINFAGAGIHRGGPREPWHDTHARVAGEAAHDILSNFEHRWAKPKQCACAFPPIIKPKSGVPTHAHRRWNVQVFRSIDRVSSLSLPAGASVERSIHDAYVMAIRRAERYIYIENQYFIGGCHLWEKDQQSGCKNLIPVEIALKVARKIRAGQRFAVYILMPMWPEGVPESEPVQDILHWSRLTMGMMYRIIGEAVRECGVKAHPRDYLNFFCLANREVKAWGELVPPLSPPRATHYWKAQKNRRFMIYVHSKLMIVDDEYVMIGSANVNQRSMDGDRDTEIAIGCYQPEINVGDVHAFRMSLWYEHTGRIEEEFMRPESLECVRSMRRIGERMWDVFCRELVTDMEGVHLVNYPVDVCEDGRIEELMGGGGVFPDTTTPIKGKRSRILPPVCTT